MKPRKPAVVLATLALLGTMAGAAIWLSHGPSAAAVRYKSQPLSYWFYGSRTNFSDENFRHRAQEACNALGTNGFAFLLSRLEGPGGNSALYFKLYRAMSPRIQHWLRYPLSADDIRMAALQHMWALPALPKEGLQDLAERVPGLRNPRVRIEAFQLLLRKAKAQPFVLDLCRNLLSDEAAGIRLEAAIALGESATAADPKEPRLFPLLLDALQKTEPREASAELGLYPFGQPPGAPAASVAKKHPQLIGLQEMYIQARIGTALEKLKPYLTEDQKNLLARARKGLQESPPGARP